MRVYYDLSFVTEPVGDDLVEQLYAAGFDLTVSGFDGLDFVSTTVLAEDPVAAAKGFAETLETFGVRVLRLDLGLVSQAMIADLCQVSREAVSQWTKKTGFPKPWASVKGPLWVWGEVNQWLRQTGKSFCEDTNYPSPIQVAQFNAVWQPLAEEADETARMPVLV